MKKRIVKIENWFDIGGQLLIGQVYGHPNFAEGTCITTSRIMSRDNDTITTRNTIYKLGKPQRGPK